MDEVQGTTPPEDVAIVDDVVGSPETTDELVPDDTFVSSGNDIEDFFRVNKIDEEVQPEEPMLPDQVAQEAAPEPKAEESDNDTVRYQYWQSEADKARNELEALKKQVAEQPQKQEAAQQEESYESFPPPPSKPSKPGGFSREEAWSDPSSASAKYLDEVDQWRDSMDEYNSLKQDYNVAVINEEREKLVRERQDIQRKQAEKEAYDKNVTMIGDHLAKTYNASAEEIKDFVNVMDKPESVTVDNLFQLYRMRQNGTVQGQPEGGTIEQAESSTPSQESFDQMKRAQQVPSPMGVLPSANKSTSSSPEETVMDSMISEYKSRNPWN